MSTIHVRVGNHNIHFDRVTFEKWFPGLAALFHWHHHVDTEALAIQLKLRLASHTSVPIRSQHIVDALEDLFRALGGTGFDHYWGSKDGRVREMMEQTLRDEQSGTDYRGLYRTRTQFLILCVVAFCTQSGRLAATLGSFIENRVHRILEYEEPLLLTEWCLGLHELQNFIPGYQLQHMVDRMSDVRSGLMGGWNATPYYGHYSPKPRFPVHRGWPLLELPGLPDWDSRAVQRFRSVDDLQVGRPLRSAWPSPIMSPARLGLKGHIDDTGAIKHEQLVQAIELEQVKQRVKQLEYFK